MLKKSGTRKELQDGGDTSVDWSDGWTVCSHNEASSDPDDLRLVFVWLQ